MLQVQLGVGVCTLAHTNLSKIHCCSFLDFSLQVYVNMSRPTLCVEVHFWCSCLRLFTKQSTERKHAKCKLLKISRLHVFPSCWVYVCSYNHLHSFYHYLKLHISKDKLCASHIPRKVQYIITTLVPSGCAIKDCLYHKPTDDTYCHRTSDQLQL